MSDNQTSVLLESNLTGIKLIARGKVRDVYQMGDDILFIATDRISAFDVVLPNGIPRKGEVLTKLSIFWFDFLKDLLPTHFLTANVDEYPEDLHQFSEQLAGRSMMVKKLEMVPIECVARGYLAGSGWKEYQAQGTVCGIELPSGLVANDLLPEPIFTPATKALEGHDENISFEHACGIVGEDLCQRLRTLTLDIYMKAQRHALTCGLMLADTKFEFGLLNSEIVLADEVLTPDSSRYWPLNSYQPGQEQPSYDKQYVRDYLEKVRFNKQPPGPVLPAEVVANTSSKYQEAYRALTGKEL